MPTYSNKWARSSQCIQLESRWENWTLTVAHHAGISLLSTVGWGPPCKSILEQTPDPVPERRVTIEASHAVAEQP